MKKMIAIVERMYMLYMRNCIKFNHLGKGIAFTMFCDISPLSAPFIYIGNNVFLGKDVWINVPDDYVKTDPPVIKIHDGVAIGRRCAISGVNQIEIGKKVMFGPGVFVTDHLHEFRDNSRPIINQGVTEPGSIIIEDGCWLGNGCAIISSEGDTITLGKNTIVGANTVVTKSFPAYSTLCGIPARNVGKVVGR